MKAIHAGVLALVTSLAFVPAANGSGTLASCSPGAQSATSLPGGYYVSLPREEIWKEANGKSGLQLRPYTCSDGSVIPPDQCLTVNPFTGANQEVLCAIAFAGSMLA